MRFRRGRSYTEKLSSESLPIQLHVLLTGTTGNVGSYLLDQLLNHSSVSRITCLNRSAEARERQLQACRQRDLCTDFETNQVDFVQADFADPRLGLPDTQYAALASSVDLVIHNAWPVDFNRNIHSFRPSIDGTMHMIDFCNYRTAPVDFSEGKARLPTLVFISSVGATSNWSAVAPTSRASIPEAELKDWRIARTGYGQSKLVSERLLSHACMTTGLPVTIIRVGQLAGPVAHGLQGKWNEQEWVPSIIRSARKLQALPQTLGPTEVVDWVPVDIASEVIVELCMVSFCYSGEETTPKERKRIRPRFFHVVNPNLTSWGDLAPAVLRCMPSVQAVPFVEWVALLKQSAKSAGALEDVDGGENPAVKLLDFFDNLQDRAIRFPNAKTTLLATRETQNVSSVMNNLQSVSTAWVELWMEQWCLK